MADKDFVVKNGLVVNNFLSVNATTIYVGNDVSNATVNTTIYTASSNNTLYVGSVSAVNVVSNAQLSANLALYQTLVDLQANVAKLHANSALYLGASTDNEGSLYFYTNYARYTAPGVFSNNITINGNVVFANVNQTSPFAPNKMIVVGNATFQNSVTVTGSYLNTAANLVSFGSALYITDSGNVGLGNNTPADKLVVSGTANVTSTLYVNGSVTFANTLALTGAATFSNSLSVANLTSTTNSAVFGTAVVILPSGNVGIVNTTPADMLSVTGNVAVSDTIKIGAATINATNYSGTAANATSLGGVLATNYVTTTGITGTLSSYFKKTEATSVSGNTVFNANIEIRDSNLVINTSSTIVANGTIGVDGQALFSNGSTIFWGPISAGSFAAPGTATQVIFNDAGSLAAYSGITFTKSSNTLTVGTATINATNYSQTANNSLYLGGSAAADYAKKDYTIKLGTTDVALNRSSGALSLAGVTVDTAENSNKLGTVIAANYQLNSTLAANVALLTSYNTSYVGATAAADVASKSYVSSSLSDYTTTASLHSSDYAYAAKYVYNNADPNGAVLTFNNSSTSGTSTYVWGSSDGATWNSYSPANFTVSRAATAGAVDNGVVTTGAYSNPSWITAIAGSKISGSVTTSINVDGAGYGSFGSGGVYITGNQINASTNLNAPSELAINYSGYQNGITQFRDTRIFNGKNTSIAYFEGLTGAFTAAGNVTAYSDIKLKTDIETIDNALDKVSKMRGVMYTRKDTGSRGTGVIAQEIQQVLPEVVQEGETLSVAYGNIVGVLIEAIKELKAEIDQLKGK